jgi:hypothetical protein
MLHLGLKRLFNRLLPACGMAAVIILLQHGNAGAAASVPTLETGFRQMYNLDFEAAHHTFEAWEQLHPNDPLGAASNAAAYLFAEFERLRILDFELFTDNKKFEQQKKVEPDPGVRNAFERELAKADSIAKEILSHSSDDRDALFARVMTDGLRGNYAALIEKKNGAGLDFLKSSRSTAEKLLKIDPDYHDAYLALGIENYVLGLRSAPSRFMLRLSGAQTNKEKGLASLRTTAERGRYMGPYARLLLAIAALRDKDKDTARKLIADLARDFPKNHLYRVQLDHLRS